MVSFMQEIFLKCKGQALGIELGTKTQSRGLGAIVHN